MKRALIFNDTSATRHFGCSAVMSNLSQKCQAENISPSWFWPVGVDWRPYSNQIYEDVDVNCVIVNGEGSIHHSATRRRARYLIEVAEFSRKKLGVPVFLINATVSDLDATSARGLQYFDKIFVRESRSKAYLAKIGVPSEVVPDLSMSIDDRLPVGSRDSFPLVTDSVNPEDTNNLRAYAIGRNYNYTSLVEPVEFSERIWRKIRKTIFPEDKNAKLKRGLQEEINYSKFLNKLAKANIVVTGRFHAVTLACKCFTPFICISSNTHKIEALIEDVGLNPNRTMERGMLFSGGGDKLLHGLSNFSKDEKNSIETYLSRAEEKTKAMFRYIYRNSK